VVPLRQVSNVLTEGKDKAMTENNAQNKHLLQVCSIRELSERICRPGKSLSHPVDIDDTDRSRVAFRIKRACALTLRFRRRCKTVRLRHAPAAVSNAISRGGSLTATECSSGLFDSEQKYCKQRNATITGCGINCLFITRIGKAE
jgi:hypothetical protein